MYINHRKKGQTWSVDILMAVFVFMVILILFFGILSSMSEPEKGKRLSKDAELITKALTGRGDQSILEDNKLDTEKIQEFVLDSKKYDEIKNNLGLKGDFCVYVEDSNGNLVPMLVSKEAGPDGAMDTDDDIYIYVNGIGKGDAVINDVDCGVSYPKTQD